MSTTTTGVRHDTFTIDFELAAPLETVFTAFADPEVRRRWMRLPGGDAAYDHTFEVGAGEHATATFRPHDAPSEHLDYRSRYIDIRHAERIVYQYEARVDDILRWTALATVEFEPIPDGTALRWTEQVAFITPTGDGSHDLPHVRGATRLRLNALEAAVT